MGIMRQFKPGQLRTGSLYDISSSYAITASYAANTGTTIDTGSFILASQTSSMSVLSAQNAVTASYITTAQTASYVLNAVSSSFATSASYAVSASYAPSTAAFPYTGSARITGSLGVTGSASFTNNDQGVLTPFKFTSETTAASPSIRVVTSDGISEASLIAARVPGYAVISTAINRAYLYLGNAAGYHNVISSNDGLAFSAYDASGYNPVLDQMRLKNGNLGIGTGYSATARLDVKAQGALSSDIAFRVRNSADNDNIISIKGNRNIFLLGETNNGRIELSANGGNATMLHRATATLPSQFIIGSYGDGGSIGQIVFAALDGTNTYPTFTMNRFVSGLSTLSGSGINTAFGSNAAAFIMQNASGYSGIGANPTTTPTDHFAMYSADINGVNGTASPNFRTEDGSVLWLGTQSKLFNVTASAITASSVTASLLGTASYATQALSASYAPSTPPFPYTGSALITGSLGVTGSLSIQSPGALSADIAFRIRNSIDNDNLTYIGGNGLAIIGINSSTSPTLILDPAGSTRARLRANSSVSIDLNNSGWNNLNGGAGGWDIEATGGEIRQRNGSNYTLLSGNYFGIGRTPSARLDVQAQGALSSDIAFRVRNSADNNNLITITGDGNITIGNSSAVPSTSTLRVFSGFGGGNFLNLINDSTSFGVYQGLDMAHTGRPGYFALETAGNQGSSITRFRGGGSNSAGAKITAYIDHPGDTDKTGHWHFRTQVHLGDAYRAYQSTLGNHTLLIETGSAPTTSSANSFILYSSASSTSNAAPHFRTENGSVIKLYQQSAVSSSQGIADALTNLGLLSGSSVIASAAAFPYTGSAQITGSLTINNALYTAVSNLVNTGNTTLYAFATASYDGVFVDYTARSGSNARAGQLMGIWDNTSVNFTETTTTDFGSTTGLTLGMNISSSAIIVSASAATDGWTIKTIIRSI